MSDERHLTKGLTMNINLDDDLKQSRTRPINDSPSRPSMSQWFFIIVLGVFIANMLSWGAQNGIEYLVVKEMMRQTTEEISKMSAQNKARLERQRELNAIKAEERKLEIQEREAGLRQAMETCNYWREEYSKHRTSYNEMQRDQSCSFANQFR